MDDQTQGLTVPEAALSDFVVFRSNTGSIRAVPTVRGKGVPKEHQMRKDETFGVVIDQVPSPEVAIWKAALSCHEESFTSLDVILNQYLEEINWDRDRAFDIDRVDEALISLEYFRQEQLRGCETIGLATAKSWRSGDDDESDELTAASSEEVPGQLKLL